MAINILMPKLGLTMTEGTIDMWYKHEGDQVNKDDLLFSVTTDKLTNDITSDVDGILLKIFHEAGETVSCKTVVACVGTPDETVSVPSSNRKLIDSTNKNRDTYVRATPYAKKLAKEHGCNLSQLEVTDRTIKAKDVQSWLGHTSNIKISPTAAKMAQERNIDLSKLTGKGRIMKHDLGDTEKVKKQKLQLPDDPPPIRVSGLRRTIAENMTVSWNVSPRVTYTHSVNASEMKRLRDQLNHTRNSQNYLVSYNHILIMAVAKALMEFPHVNASFSQNQLTLHTHANIGLAVAKEDGLLVPNLKNCEEKSLLEISRETEQLIDRTRNGTIKPENLKGGTFTITNLGPYGITHFSPIINQPELAILGVCAIVDTPVIQKDSVVIQPMMNLCLTADHRVIDGAMAAQFLDKICKILENPYLLL